jgi:hypothetical protein
LEAKCSAARSSLAQAAERWLHRLVGREESRGGFVVTRCSRRAEPASLRRRSRIRPVVVALVSNVGGVLLRDH